MFRGVPVQSGDGFCCLFANEREKDWSDNRIGTAGTATSVGMNTVFVQKASCFPEINNETKQGLRGSVWVRWGAKLAFDA